MEWKTNLTVQCILPNAECCKAKDRFNFKTLTASRDPWKLTHLQATPVKGRLFLLLMVTLPFTKSENSNFSLTFKTWPSY